MSLSLHIDRGCLGTRCLENLSCLRNIVCYVYAPMLKGISTISSRDTEFVLIVSADSWVIHAFVAFDVTPTSIRECVLFAPAIQKKGTLSSCCHFPHQL